MVHKLDGLRAGALAAQKAAPWVATKAAMWGTTGAAQSEQKLADLMDAGMAGCSGQLEAAESARSKVAMLA
jgi:hypothetical protein